MLHPCGRGTCSACSFVFSFFVFGPSGHVLKSAERYFVLGVTSAVLSPSAEKKLLMDLPYFMTPTAQTMPTSAARSAYSRKEMPFLAFIFDLLCLLTPNRQYYTKFSLQVYRGCTGQKSSRGISPPLTPRGVPFMAPRGFCHFGIAIGISPSLLNHSAPIVLCACGDNAIRYHPFRLIASSHAWYSMHPFSMRNLAIPMRRLHCFRR